jgi:hypothetical protein
MSISSYTLAHHGTSKAGEKPTDRDGLLGRCLDRASEETIGNMDRNAIVIGKISIASFFEMWYLPPKWRTVAIGMWSI